MAELAPPATMKSPVRAALRGRPGLASREPFSNEDVATQFGGIVHWFRWNARRVSGSAVPRLT